MNKPVLLILFAAILLIASCNEPVGTNTWPDGSKLWLAGIYSDTALSWSPYGDVLLFSTYQSSASSIWGTNGLSDPFRRTFTHRDEFTGSLGAWNAKNGRIVYTSFSEDSTWGQIRSIPGNDIYVTVHLHDKQLNTFPTYNNNGDSILYCCKATDNWRLHQTMSDTIPDVNKPTILQGFPEGDILRPSYSPDDDSWILFQHRLTSSDDWDVMIAHPDGSDQRILAASSAVDMHPTWGPDNQWISFTSNRTGNYEIYITDINNDTLIQVTDDPATDQYPAWNPEKHWIAFSSDRLSTTLSMDIFAITEPELP